MRIESLTVSGLLGRDSDVHLNFHADVNIITGRNGSGKTSLLKLLWFLISGNILQALREVPFRKATVKTDIYEVTVHRTGHATCKIDWHDSSGSESFSDIVDDDGDVVFNAEDEPSARLSQLGTSVFLPTFRRIEGGFTLTQQVLDPSARAKTSIEEGLLSLSRSLSRKSHVFVAALSTADIVNLLVRQYTELSERATNLQRTTSQEIITTIKELKKDQDAGDFDKRAIEVLEEIKTKIEAMEGSRAEVMKPLSAVRDLTMKMLRHSGIKLGKNLSFGDAANAISSDALSAGEKQFLSFIAYNAFHRDAVFIVDEPELSLHVDWQRQLVPTLVEQQAGTQFVVATHSPFIYGKFPDKELLIDTDRGDDDSWGVDTSAS